MCGRTLKVSNDSPSRVSPEAVVLAQLAMLECGDVDRAARFNAADVSKVLMGSIAIGNSASHLECQVGFSEDSLVKPWQP